MRAFHRLCACTATALVIAGMSTPVAVAQGSYPTTPTPHPVDPDQPPGWVAQDSPRPVIGDAGTMLGVLRVLPATVPGDSFFNDPGFEDQLPKQSVLEAGMGRAVAQVNSESLFAHERSIAEASPAGVAITGHMPQLPGVGLAQTALADHEEPTSTSLAPPASPADQLVKLSGLNGSVHARWNEQTGPCGVAPLSDARYAMGQGSVVQLPGLGGALVDVPSVAEAHSHVRLADVPGQARTAVVSTSELQISQVKLLSGTPQEISIEVVGRPKLVATATGDPATSRVDYTAPVLRISQAGKEIAVLDVANPVQDLPIPPIPGLNQQLLDLGVLRISVGELEDQSQGEEVKGTARLFDLKLLDGTKLGLPASLAQISFGEQVARAVAPAGGVDCAPPAAGAVGDGSDVTPVAHQQGRTPPLALTSGSYFAVPIFWTGAALLLLGSVLVAAVPRRGTKH
ncbi:hypothetical protein EIL87_10525 [Saccharopolyspora rhizosphaerae]|uniref:Uncharacterized protein n=1 Tax=Saccharopolyspora rhizosphaerae TaxID=2492662 RepID=A0A426JVL0_9PSEU|nr:hypothetical protein [Saccharopolyspora rhizosphaerae]RRO17235.1 hypothetical protein EIL87_10525 [Saccharopolyspora rhizosphaerae]